MTVSEIDHRAGQLGPEGLQKRKNECLLTIRRTIFVLVTVALSSLIVLAKPDQAIFLGTINEINIPQINIALGFNEFLIVGPVVLVVVWAYLHAFLAELRGSHLSVIDASEPALPVLSGPLPALMTWFAEIPLVPVVLVVFAVKAGFSSMVGMWSAAAAIAVILAFGAPAWRNLAGCNWIRGSVHGLLLGVGLYASLLPQWPSLAPERLSLVLEIKLRNMVRLNLKGLDLSGLKLCEQKSAAEIRRAEIDFGSVRLNHADLSNALLVNCNLSLIEAPHGKFEGADLKNAKLDVAYLPSAQLASANLEGASIRSARLQNANLSYATLRDADLSLSNLQGVILEGADLSNANLATARNLTREQVQQACHRAEHGEVRLPADFRQPPECRKN